MPETPSQAPTLQGMLNDLAALEAVTGAWDEGRRDTVQALQGALETLHAEALRRLIRSLQQDPACLAHLKAAAGDEVVYAVLRRHGLLRPSLQERVEAALESVRPALAEHEGNVELISVDPPDTVTVRLKGACEGCPASLVTLSQGIEQAIRAACPEIQHIRTANPASIATDATAPQRVSPFATQVSSSTATE